MLTYQYHTLVFDIHKFLNYLERIKNILTRKILGNKSLSTDEKQHLEELQRKEKPKGYIPSQVLIPSLQEDISKTQFTYDCLINEYNNKTSVDTNISSYMNNNTSVNNINNKSSKSILTPKNRKYDLKKI